MSDPIYISRQDVKDIYDTFQAYIETYSVDGMSSKLSTDVTTGMPDLTLYPVPRKQDIEQVNHTIYTYFRRFRPDPNLYKPITYYTGTSAGTFINDNATDLTFEDYASGVLGTVHTKSEYVAAGELAVNLFDYDYYVDGVKEGTKWLDFNSFEQLGDPTNASSADTWVSYYSPNNEIRVVTKYVLVTANDDDEYPGRTPINWQLQGYEGTTGNWITLDKRGGEFFPPPSGGCSGYSRTFEVHNPGYYTWYRLYISAINDPTTVGFANRGLMQLGGLQLWGFSKQALEDLIAANPFPDAISTIPDYNKGIKNDVFNRMNDYKEYINNSCYLCYTGDSSIDTNTCAGCYNHRHIITCSCNTSFDLSRCWSYGADWTGASCDMAYYDLFTSAQRFDNTLDPGATNEEIEQSILTEEPGLLESYFTKGLQCLCDTTAGSLVSKIRIYNGYCNDSAQLAYYLSVNIAEQIDCTSPYGVSDCGQSYTSFVCGRYGVWRCLTKFGATSCPSAHGFDRRCNICYSPTMYTSLCSSGHGVDNQQIIREGTVPDTEQEFYPNSTYSCSAGAQYSTCGFDCRSGYTVIDCIARHDSTIWFTYTG